MDGDCRTCAGNRFVDDLNRLTPPEGACPKAHGAAWSGLDARRYF